jgi:hypothetical protein
LRSERFVLFDGKSDTAAAADTAIPGEEASEKGTEEENEAGDQGRQEVGEFVEQGDIAQERILKVRPWRFEYTSEDRSQNSAETPVCELSPDRDCRQTYQEKPRTAYARPALVSSAVRHLQRRGNTPVMSRIDPRN